MTFLYKRWVALSSLFLIIFCLHGFASTKSQLQALVPQVQSIAAQSEIISAIAAANQSHATIGSKEIRVLGREWHQGLAGQQSQVLAEVNNSDLSTTLKNIQSQNAAQYKGLLVTDAKGLVIGQTYNADHYSQAHRSIWSKIDKQGAKAIYYGKAKKTSAGDVADLGLPIVQDNKVIGAILVSVPVTAEPSKAKKHSSRES